MCVVVSRPIEIVTLLRKNGDPAKWVVDFPLERDTFRKTIMEIVKGFVGKITTTTTANPGIVDDFAFEGKNRGNL